MHLRFQKFLAQKVAIAVTALTATLFLCAHLNAFALDGQAQINQSVKTDDHIDRCMYGPKEFGPAPTIVWQSQSARPKAVIVALHGLIMHGGVFDTLARHLVNEGYVVAAPDMRGYGRWKSGNEACEVSYDETFEDIIGLVKKLRTQYPDTPLYCVGESLGADMSMRVASVEPKLVDGLILSSPAIKHRTYLGPLVANMPLLIARPNKQIDLVPYIRKYSSEDPRIIDGELNDPLVRKKLSASELVKSVAVFKDSLNYARQIPPSIPVLVIQGSDDRVVKSNAVVGLLGTLRSSDQTVRWFTARGHLLLETDYVCLDTMQIVKGWLKEHVDEAITARQEQAVTTSADTGKTPKESVDSVDAQPDQDKLSEDMSRSRL